MLNVHAYKPGDLVYVYLNIASALIYLLLEIIIIIKLGLAKEKKGKEGLVEKVKRIFSFSSYIAIGLAGFQLIYCILLLSDLIWVELFLPFINLLSWIKLIQELSQLEVIRKFLIVFMASI